MQDDEVDLIPKMLLLMISFILYYTSLFLTLRYSKTKCKPTARFRLTMAGVAISFIALMLIFRQNMYVNIALTVAYVFGIYGLLYKFRKTVG